MKATLIGPVEDCGDEVTVFGITFPRDEAMDVTDRPEIHARLRRHAHFKVTESRGPRKAD